MENIDLWNKNYNLAKIYYEKNGNLLIPNRFKTKNGYDYDENGIFLGVWIRTQRKKYNKVIKSAITQEQIEKLNEIGMVWKIERYADKDYIDLATKYYRYHGSLLVHEKFKTKNGYDYDKSGVPLGYWIRKQRNLYPNLKKEVIDTLEKIGMVWDPYKARFDNMLALATNYYEKNGDLNIPLNFKTKNGYEYDPDGFNLGMWFCNIKKAELYKSTMSFTQERFERLKDIGYKQGKNMDIKFERYINMLEEYYKHHGNYDIKYGFKTKNGYEYDEHGFCLGSWVRRQEELKDKGLLENDKLKRFEEIGCNLKCENQTDIWNKMYQLASIYYKHNNNLAILRSFKTKKGYEYDPNGLNLGRWIQTQRQCYSQNKLSDEKIKKLNEIEMIWNKKEYDFYNGNITPRVKKEILKQFRDYLETINLNQFKNKEDIQNINSEFSKVLTYNNIK